MWKMIGKSLILPQGHIGFIEQREKKASFLRQYWSVAIAIDVELQIQHCFISIIIHF